VPSGTRQKSAMHAGGVLRLLRSAEADMVYDCLGSKSLGQVRGCDLKVLCTRYGGELKGLLASSFRSNTRTQQSSTWPLSIAPLLPVYNWLTYTINRNRNVNNIHTYRGSDSGVFRLDYLLAPLQVSRKTLRLTLVFAGTVYKIRAFISTLKASHHFPTEFANTVSKLIFLYPASPHEQRKVNHPPAQ
jgi:hypothetical protein